MARKNSISKLPVSNPFPVNLNPENNFFQPRQTHLYGIDTVNTKKKQGKLGNVRPNKKNSRKS